mgnify:CR=1 FL=1
MTTNTKQIDVINLQKNLEEAFGKPLKLHEEEIFLLFQDKHEEYPQ